MTAQSKAVNKGRFETGDVPTQSHFSDLIDSYKDYWKDNLEATTDPTVSDDNVSGYTVGSRWVNNVTKLSFLLLDAATGAADWRLSMDTAMLGDVPDLGRALENDDALLVIAGITGPLANGGYRILVSEVTFGTGDMLIATYDPAVKSAQVLVEGDALNEDMLAVTATDSTIYPPSQFSTIVAFSSCVLYEDMVTEEKLLPIIADRVSFFDSENGDIPSDVPFGTLFAVLWEASVADINTGTSILKAVTPDALAGSNLATESAGLVVFESDEPCVAGDGTQAIPIPASMNGMNIVEVRATVHTKGVTGAMDVQVRRRRAGTNVDVLSTKVTVGDEWTVADGVINASNDDLASGDQLYIDVDALHTTPANGLSVSVSARLP